MREKLLAIGDDFWIENEQGERAYKVNGKAVRLRQTFVLEDPSGDEVVRIQERKLSIRDKIAIERGGDTAAT
ncbi:MAG TPA: LURP-one-related family protein, partial [Solirubrobacteraceae bacterium]